MLQLQQVVSQHVHRTHTGYILKVLHGTFTLFVQGMLLFKVFDDSWGDGTTEHS